MTFEAAAAAYTSRPMPAAMGEMGRISRTNRRGRSKYTADRSRRQVGLLRGYIYCLLSRCYQRQPFEITGSMQARHRRGS